MKCSLVLVCVLFHLANARILEQGYNRRVYNGITANSLIANKDLGSNGLGCPRSRPGQTWVLYGKHKPRCFILGRPAKVCDNFSVMSRKPGSTTEGVCTCDFQKCLEFSARSEERSTDSDFLFCTTEQQKNEMVYDNRNSRCYYINSQGPCEKGKVLIRNGTEGVKCEDGGNQRLNRQVANCARGSNYDYDDYDGSECETSDTIDQNVETVLNRGGVWG